MRGIHLVHAPSGRFRRGSGVVGVGGFGSVLAWFGLGALDLDPPLQIAVAGGLAGLSIAVGLALMVQRVHVEVDADPVSVHYGPLPFPPGMVWNRRDVLGFLVQHRTISRDEDESMDVWDVQVHLSDGREVSLVEGMHSVEEAAHLRRRLERGLAQAVS